MKTNNIKVWQYFCWLLAFLSILLAIFSLPKNGKLTDIQAEIKSTNRAIAQAAKPNDDTTLKHVKSFDVVKAESTASAKLSNGLEMALGGYKNGSEYQHHRAELDQLFGRKFDTLLYKMNGNPESTYAAADNAKFKFTIPEKAVANIGFNDVSTPEHAQVTAIVRYKPSYLTYGVIKIIDIDYDLNKQKVNVAHLNNLQNAQLKGFYDEND